MPDHLARGVAGGRWGAVGGQRILEGGVSAAAVEEAVVDAGVGVRTDDLATGVDALCEGTVWGVRQRIVEGGVGVDWHDAGSVVIVSLRAGDRRLCLLRHRQQRLL